MLSAWSVTLLLFFKKKLIKERKKKIIKTKHYNADKVKQSRGQKKIDRTCLNVKRGCV